jgi:hypothetical protein
MPMLGRLWRLFKPGPFASSCVRSVILTDERFLHFQLRQERRWPRVPFRSTLARAYSTPNFCRSLDFSRKRLARVVVYPSVNERGVE